MHARTVAVAFRPDQLDAAAGIMREVADDLRGREGFHELIFVADRASGQGTVISLWETAEARDAAESQQYREAMARLAPLLAGPPTRAHAEVLVHSHPGAH